MDQIGSILFFLGLAVVAFFVYFTPAILAIAFNRKQMVAISVANLFLGWTFLGWVAAGVWALMEDK